MCTCAHCVARLPWSIEETKYVSISENCRIFGETSFYIIAVCVMLFWEVVALSWSVSELTNEISKHCDLELTCLASKTCKLRISSQCDFERCVSLSHVGIYLHLAKLPVVHPALCP